METETMGRSRDRMTLVSKTPDFNSSTTSNLSSKNERRRKKWIKTMLKIHIICSASRNGSWSKLKMKKTAQKCSARISSASQWRRKQYSRLWIFVCENAFHWPFSHVHNWTIGKSCVCVCLRTVGRHSMATEIVVVRIEREKWKMCRTMMPKHCRK